MARPVKLLSLIVLTFVAVGLLLSPRIGVARPIPMAKALLVRDGEQQGCRAEDLNAAPFAAPSKAHRWGTVVVGCYKDNHAQLEEWDLFAGRALRTVKLPTPPDDNQIRVAHGAGHVAVVMADALQGGGNPRLLLLDDSFKLDKSWDLKVDYADLAADGALAVVAGRGQTGMRITALDLAHERVVARRVIPYGKMIFPAYDRPEQIVRVHKNDIFIAMHDRSALHVIRLDKKLRTRAAYTHHSKDGIDYGAGEYGLVLDQGEPVLQVRGQVYTLPHNLGHATPLRSSTAHPPRWAISPKGQVAAEDGRIAASKGAPFVRALRYTNEVVVRGMKREIRANATRYVFWAFGRAVIVRSAMSVGITAIQPR
jgi:hypothetical protein